MEISSHEATQHAVIADLHLLERLLPTFLGDSEPEEWQRRNPHVSASEWTLHQTVAHLTSAAEFYLSTLQHVLRQETLVIHGFQQRKDLAAYNQQEILRRQHLQPAELILSLQQALADTASLAQQLKPEQLLLLVTVPVFNRPLTILELLEMQAVHPGIVHAMQIALPVGKDPLWKYYESACMHRMLARFFHLMSLVYWPERGGDLRMTLQFLVAGAAGGAWYINVAPVGSQCGEGQALKPQVTFWAANADVLCQFFTGYLSMRQAFFRRKLFMWGNLLLATKLGHQFSPI